MPNDDLFIDPLMYQRDDRGRWPRDHAKWLSAVNDIPDGHYLVPTDDQSVVLINDHGKIRCVSNICTHKKAVMFSGAGVIGSTITCPVHKWSWSKSGKILGARGFDKSPCMDLPEYQLDHMNGHLFVSCQEILNEINEIDSISTYLDIRDYELHSTSRIQYSFDWKIFMEIFLDLYHVRSCHPGLKSLADCNTFEWTFGKGWALQTADYNSNGHPDEFYAELLLTYEKMGYVNSSKYGAVWLGIYPNIMLEYYPGSIVVSKVWPNGAGQCINHLEFYYQRELVDQFPSFPDVQQRAFMKTADEDEEIGVKLQKGAELVKSPYAAFNHPTEEAGFVHFHRWLKTNGYIEQATK